MHGVRMKQDIACFIKVIARIRIVVDGNKALLDQERQGLLDGPGPVEIENAGLEFLGVVELQEGGVLRRLVAVHLSDAVGLLGLALLIKLDVVPVFEKAEQRGGAVVALARVDLPAAQHQHDIAFGMCDTRRFHGAPSLRSRKR